MQYVILGKVVPRKGVDYWTEEDKLEIGKTITPDLIGAAPAGYGLGTFPQKIVTSVEELDTLTACGTYIFQCVGATVGNVPFNYATVEVVAFDNAACYQKLVPIATVTELYRYKHDGKWCDWCIKNPPLTPGLAYRTTEEFDGKPVYTALVNCGKPSDGAQFVDLSVFGNNNYWVVNAVGFNSSGVSVSMGHPYVNAVGAESGRLYLDVGGSGYIEKLLVQIKWTQLGD